MNYTGRPSISGCRPVLPLYPTHHFCQYLLGIFITFTNSSLFCRAFSTNSRRPSQLKAPPLGELAGASPTERARLLTANPRHSDSIALTKSLPIAAQRLFRAGLALSVIASQCHCPGCGSQRLLRCRSHPAGRGPNSSSLFPPLAAVVAVAPKGRGFGRPHRSLYLFGEKSGIMVLRPCPPIYSGGEVRKMESILSFILSVGANVAAYYICKWLDGWFMGRKH